jgi:Zn-dependent protease with chaperone function
MSQQAYRVEPKENLYFILCLIISLVIYAGIVVGAIAAVESGKTQVVSVVAGYAVVILLVLHFFRGMLVGYIRGNAVKLGPHQFNDIHSVVMSQARKLGLTRIPDVYLLQQGGALNAFATRFMGTDFIVLYSDVMEAAYEENLETVEFIIAHELGHVKRNHILKRLIVLPAMFVPFLGNAYSRACEYTCDSIGASISEAGARSGMLVLAAGTKLFRKVNTHQFLEQAHTESGFWLWFSEKTSTHPHLAKRLARFPEKEIQHRSAAAKAQDWSVPKSELSPKTAEQKEEPAAADDLSRFMPK